MIEHMLGKLHISLDGIGVRVLAIDNIGVQASYFIPILILHLFSVLWLEGYFVKRHKGTKAQMHKGINA